MRKFIVALVTVVALAGSCSGTSRPKVSPPTTGHPPPLPVGRATATMTSCNSTGGSTILTGRVTNPLPKNGEVILIVGRFNPSGPTGGPSAEVSSEVELGPNRVATFTIRAPHANSACSITQTRVDLVLLPGVPYEPQNSGSITGAGQPLPTPTSLVGQPLSS